MGKDLKNSIMDFLRGEKMAHVLFEYQPSKEYLVHDEKLGRRTMKRRPAKWVVDFDDGKGYQDYSTRQLVKKLRLTL